MFDAIGGRKLIFGVLITIAGVALIIQGKLTAEATAFLLGMYATFAGANVIATVKGLAASGPEELANAEPVRLMNEQDMRELKGATAHLIERQAASEQGLQVIQTSIGGLQKAMAAILSSRQS
jgi:hypothetical protein